MLQISSIFIHAAVKFIHYVIDRLFLDLPLLKRILPVCVPLLILSSRSKLLPCAIFLYFLSISLFLSKIQLQQHSNVVYIFTEYSKGPLTDGYKAIDIL